jgi:hypothetical protein
MVSMVFASQMSKASEMKGLAQFVMGCKVRTFLSEWNKKLSWPQLRLPARSQCRAHFVVDQKCQCSVVDMYPSKQQSDYIWGHIFSFGGDS